MIAAGETPSLKIKKSLQEEKHYSRRESLGRTKYNKTDFVRVFGSFKNNTITYK